MPIFFSTFSINLLLLGSSINLFRYRRLRFVTRFKQNFEWLTLIKRSFLEFYFFLSCSMIRRSVIAKKKRRKKEKK